jgi:hypothetical protein
LMLKPRKGKSHASGVDSNPMNLGIHAIAYRRIYTEELSRSGTQRESNCALSGAGAAHSGRFARPFMESECVLARS